MNKEHDKPSITTSIPWWVWSVVLVMFSAVLCYKIALTPWTAQLDFPTLLSLLLAFFAVGLASLFYFKATDTSNAFYDNTYKFTRDISELLVKIESGFGEKLTHLDETYRGMRERFDTLPFPAKSEIKDTKRELKEEEEVVKQLQEEKAQIVKQLVDTSKLAEEEKRKIMADFAKKETAYASAQVEIQMLRARLHEMESRRNVISQHELEMRLTPIIVRYVLPKIVGELSAGSSLAAVSKLRDAIVEYPERVLFQLRQYGVIDSKNNLTPDGLHLIKKIYRASKHDEVHNAEPE